MTEVWTPSATHVGRWLVSSGAWDTSTGLNSNYAGYVRYAGNLDVPPSSITSAPLTFALNRTAELYIVRDAVVPANGNRPDTATLHHFHTHPGGQSAVDIAEPLQEALSGPWSPGDALGIYIEATQGGAVQQYSLDLSIQWEPVQELDPVTIHVPVSVGAVEPSYSITPATITVPVAVGRVDVLAPRSLTPATVTVGATAAPIDIRGTGPAPPLGQAHTIAVGVSVGVPFLSITRPPPTPPQPWERLIANPAYIAALGAETITTDFRLEILDHDGVPLAQLGRANLDVDAEPLPGILEGSVKYQWRSPIRWDLDVRLDNPDLIPHAPTDLLHPHSLNTVQAYWRILIGGVWEEIPVGRYHPQEDPHSDTGLISNRLIGSDSVAVLKRATWDTALDLGGLTTSQAIAQIVADRAPWLKVAITPTQHTVGADYEPGEPGTDPWDDIQALADAADMVVGVDRVGVLRLEPNPGTGPAVADFSEGPGTALMGLPQVQTPVEYLNSVTVASADPDVQPPVTGTWRNDDTSTPLGRALSMGYLYHKRIENAIVTTKAQAETFARNYGQNRSSTIEVQLAHLPHPHLDGGDVITINRPQAGVVGDHTLVGWELGTRPGSLQVSTAQTRKGTSWEALG